MSLRVLIMPDKFKGTLKAREAAEAMARGWRSRRPQDELDLVPMSDGGDGFGEIMSALRGAQPREVQAVDAAHRPCQATWWWDAPSATAIVESAQVIGLAQLPPGRFHPFELDSEGLGMVLQSAAREGALKVVVGIGGSATNDAGFGMAKALGWRFFKKHGHRIGRWTELHALSELRQPAGGGLFREILVAVDVQNPLLGPRGCTRIYGPQKGLRPEDFEFAERCLGQLSALFAREWQLDCANEPGAGAAGGLGFGLRCFLGARLRPGFALFAEEARLEERLSRAEVVLTGEGAIDMSTVMGKGVGQLADLCHARGIPCLGFGGTVTVPEEVSPRFARTYCLTPNHVTRDEALSRPAESLEGLVAQAAGAWR